MRLIEVADVIRSKNSGPYEITFDIILKDAGVFRQMKAGEILNKEILSELYGIKTDDVISIVWFDPAKAVKATILRPCASGSIGDTDIYGAQQHVPLLNWEFTV